MKLLWDTLQDIEEIKRIFNENQLLLASGDTVLGLYAPLTIDGYEGLNQAKNRFDKPYLVLISSPHMLPYFIDQIIDEKLQRLIDISWPGPVTIIFKAKADLPSFIKSSSGTIALRVPDHKGLQQLLKSYKGLFSTSANIHTEPIPTKISSVNSELLAHVGAVCLDKNMKSAEIPSTILDCSAAEIKIIRKGAINIEKLRKIGIFS